MLFLLKTSARENLVGKNRYIGKRYNVCIPPIYPDLQHQEWVLVHISLCT